MMTAYFQFIHELNKNLLTARDASGTVQDSRGPWLPGAHSPGGRQTGSKRAGRQGPSILATPHSPGLGTGV